jgi:dTDP-4-dehydrorhamnose reductase
MKRFIVTGAAGLLGQHLVKRLLASDGRSSPDLRILAVDIAENPFDEFDRLEYLRADLTDIKSVETRLRAFRGDHIFNCASYNDVDSAEEEKEKAHRINTLLVKDLLILEEGRIIQFSSDYVFNGAAGPYFEDDSPDPINYYGRTKLEAEKILRGSEANHLIIRSNVLYGIARRIRKNFVTWLVENLRAGKETSIVVDQYCNPTYSGNLAEAAIEAAENKISGILHVAGRDYLSRYDMALGIASYFNLDTDLIKPVDSIDLDQKAKRPLKGGLRIDRALKLLKTRLLGLEQGLRLMSEI